MEYSPTMLQYIERIEVSNTIIDIQRAILSNQQRKSVDSIDVYLFLFASCLIYHIFISHQRLFRSSLAIINIILDSQTAIYQVPDIQEIQFFFVCSYSQTQLFIRFRICSEIQVVLCMFLQRFFSSVALSIVSPTLGKTPIISIVVGRFPDNIKELLVAVSCLPTSNFSVLHSCNVVTGNIGPDSVTL